MGWWRLSTDTLAESRFVVSPLAETTACLLALHKNAGAHPGERAWLDAHLAAYRARLAGDPVTALLVRSALRPGWIADFVVPPSSGAADPAFHDELTAIREVPADQVHRHLEVALRGPVPAGLRRTDLAERLAGLLEWIWTEMVQPDWARRRRVIEADIVARTAQLGQAGWAAAFDAMRPGMRWLGEGRLQINRYDSPPRDLSGTRLLFVPVTPGVGWVSWNDSDRHAVIYPCSGVLAGPEPAPVSDALGALLGPARARVLVLLDTPKTTTQLVALTGQGLGSVGRHLRVLLDARLVRRRRAGRAVLYDRTAAGEVLIRAQAPDDGGPSNSKQ
ncbi:ArsR family transcriptional regulator [Actinoallomurus soli]|uniref:ArsR family transcriptional regulator n=1 Tax=Actinoallomurus soli TaxID=2952535 RepID=UPI002092EA8A|nr:ArsR family transcriptional regulator [Actinoallomurus soli]MCO5967539.1 ArsR family transcriptional regulator [Actinoallomurus soli]